MHARGLIFVCVFLVDGTADAQSRRWFSPEMSCWITHQKVPALWEDAQRRCERDGAVLASPLNMQLFNYMQSLINVKNHSAAYFIGIRAKHSDDGQEVLYVSVEGRRLDEMPSAVFDEIDQLDLEQGDCLSMDRHGIRAVSCLDHLPYICYSNETSECGSALATSQTTSTSVPSITVSVPTTTASVPTTTASVPTTTASVLTTSASVPTTTASVPTTTTPSPTTTRTIPSGYTYKSATGSYYKFHKRNELTWHEANAACASEGAHVVVLNNTQEVDIVQGVVRDGLGTDNKHVWTGLQSTPSKGWHTVNGEPLSEVFHQWGGGSNPSNSEACTFFYAKYKELYDYPCNGKHVNIYFVCEISQ